MADGLVAFGWGEFLSITFILGEILQSATAQRRDLHELIILSIDTKAISKWWQRYEWSKLCRNSKLNCDSLGIGGDSCSKMHSKCLWLSDFCHVVLLASHIDIVSRLPPPPFPLKVKKTTLSALGCPTSVFCEGCPTSIFCEGCYTLIQYQGAEWNQKGSI